MQQGDTVFYGMNHDLADAINRRHDARLYAEPGSRRPAVVLEEASQVRPAGATGAVVDLLVFLNTGRTWQVRGVVQGEPGTAGTWWPRD